MKRIYQRNYDCPPGESAEDLLPSLALRTAALNNVVMAVVPLENPPAPDERVAIFAVTKPEFVHDDPILKDLILEFAHNGQEAIPGKLAAATCVAAHRFAEAKNPPQDDDPD